MADSEERRIPEERTAAAPGAAAKESDVAPTCALSGRTLGAGIACRDGAGNLSCAACPIAREFFAASGGFDPPRAARHGRRSRERRGTR